MCADEVGRISMKALLYASVACLMFALAGSGHEGGLDELGCHHDRRERNYHCHRGPLAGSAFRNKGDAKREWRHYNLPLPPKKKKAKQDHY
jgi:hypothetical protein